MFHGVIDQRKSVFLGGRYLLHETLVATEVIDEARRTKKQCLIYKVDYEKTYDLKCWYFLLYMCQRLGFDERWIKWMKGCLKSSYVSILVNETLTF